MRFAGHHALWHKHVHNVELDPAQILKMEEMDRFDNTVDFSCRRTGKTFTKEMWLLKFLACQSDQELGIVAPREAQALVNLGYHLEAIRRSELLTAYLAHKSGRVQLADTYYQFANRSIARSYGIMAQVDGGDLTIASLEEVDDMPKDRLFSRFLLMLGSTRRAGASKEAENKPRIRITGVFKGADTLSDLVKGGHYHTLFTVHAHLGIEMGILNESFILEMRTQLAPDEYIRQMLCRNVSARNLIYEKFVRYALQKGLSAGIELQPPVVGKVRKKRGLVSLGYDASGHGEDPAASKHALVATEMVGNTVCLLFCRTWPPGTDDGVVMRDLLEIWRYFNPDYAFGDAYGVGMLTQLNDELYTHGLTPIDRQLIGDGQSTATTWQEWAFSPIRFEGMVKHQMATAVRAAFHHRLFALPYLDDQDLSDPETADLRLLVRQLPNIKPVPNKAGYSSYKMADSKLGDDLFDALMAAVWALVTRGASFVPTIILPQSVSRAEQLGEHTIQLPSDPKRIAS
ncbi:MAG: hypothetical protein HQL72_02395 [Magnetococcales bacterium]|nr:hypothetical protein [Magnetococcales bacterium]